MPYGSAFQVRSLVAFVAALLGVQSASAVNNAAFYKVAAIECAGQAQGLLGEYEARAIWGWEIASDTSEQKILSQLGELSPALRQRIEATAGELKNNAKEVSSILSRPIKTLLHPPADCGIAVVATRDQNRKVLLNEALWGKMSEALKARVFFEMAWQEMNGDWARFLSAYVASTDFHAESSGKNLDRFRQLFGMDQAVGGLEFNGFTMDEFKGVPELDLRILISKTKKPFWLRERADGSVASFGNLQDPEKACTVKMWGSEPWSYDCDKLKENPYSARLQSAGLRFPFDLKKLNEPVAQCPGSGAQRQSCWFSTSGNWAVEFAENTKSKIERLECRSSAVGNFYSQIGNDWESSVYTTSELEIIACPLEIFGQKILVFDPEAIRSFKKGVHSLHSVQVEFSDDFVTLDLPVPDAKDSAKHLTERAYRDPRTGFFYAGRIVLDSKGNVTNDDAVRVEETRSQNEGVLR